MRRRDTVPAFPYDVVGRMRAQVGTIAERRIRADRLVVSKMIAKPECLPGVGIRQRRKWSTQRNRLGCGRIEGSISRRLDYPHFANRAISVDPELNYAGTPFPIRRPLQLRYL